MIKRLSPLIFGVLRELVARYPEPANKSSISDLGPLVARYILLSLLIRAEN